MGWNSNPSDGVSFNGGTVTFPSNYGSEDKVYKLTYSDSGLTSNTFTVTVRHITIQLEISSDAYLLDGTQNSSFTITYAKRLPDGTYTHEGLTLSAYTLSTDTAFAYTVSASGITSSNEIYQRFTVNANDVNLTKQMRFKCYDDNGIESEEILIEQGGADQTVLPNFDFLTFTFNWTKDDGIDLDTMTWIDDNHIQIPNYEGTKTSTLDHLGVGFRGPGSASNSVFKGNTSKYIQHGGDNTRSGDECVLINFKELCNRDWITSGITKLYAYSFGCWYNTKKNGNCSVSMKTYKGDGMQHGTDDNKYIFVPSGNTELVSDKTFEGNVYALGHYGSDINNLQVAQEKNFYSKIFKFEYDIRNKSAIVKNLMTTRSGRYVRIEYEYNGIKKTLDVIKDSTLKTLYNSKNPYPQSGGTEQIIFDDNALNIYVNESLINHEFKEITIDYYSTSTGGQDYITDYSYENNVITLVIPPNPNNAQRNFSINLAFSYTINGDSYAFKFKFQYYQQGIETTE